MDTLLYTVVKVENTSAGISLSVVANEPDSTKVDLLLSDTAWSELKVAVGDEIDSAHFEAMNRAAVLDRAISRMMKILSYSDHSCAQLVKKLASYGFDAEIGEEAAAYAVERGYINEIEQASRAAAYFSRSKYWGKKRIALELLSRGYKRDVALAATHSVSDEQYAASLKRIMSRKYAEIPESKNERMAMFAALGRLGYSMSEIERTAEEINSERED